MIRLFAGEVGVVLVFNITVDGTVQSLTGADVKLVVPGHSRSPFQCVSVAQLGRAEYVVLADDFPVGRYPAYIQYTKGAVVLKSKKFSIVSDP